MPEVRDSPDFRRIRNLPRRTLTESDAEAWAAAMTEELRLPGSSAALRPWQGYALAEAAACDGAFIALPVGQGKTLISFLLPTLLGSKKPMLIVPGPGLREKTYQDFAEYMPHWRAPRTPSRVTTLADLAPESGATLLEQIAPDLIVVDECHKLANQDSSACRRLERYIRAHEDTIVVLMTGTPGRKSIMNYWHLLIWALRDNAPVPLAKSEAQEWAGAIDEAKGRIPSRMGTGALGPNVAAARKWYRSRLVETPGVMIVDGDSCTAPLTIRTRLAREDSKLDRAYETFLKEMVNPAGLPVAAPLDRWRFDGQLGCGLFLKYRDPQPPQPWKDARCSVAGFVRERIAASTHSARPLDTEAQVLRRYPEHPIVKAWLAICDTYKPITEAIWLSDSCIRSVQDWLAESDAPGIVWSGCVEFGERLATVLKLPYYGRQGTERYSGANLRNADPKRSLVASWVANMQGFNLQAWRRMLIVMPPQSAQYLEQIFGRAHRSGQKSHVVIDVLATSGGTLDSFEKAIAEAGFGNETISLTQKILRATIERAVPKVTASNKYRWARGAKPSATTKRLDVSKFFGKGRAVSP